ncbi:polysaccharide biosynthesis/export family protein [Sphingobacterium sp. HJSM2_6]|uniref:polysaccharide biosynthesis/export family protein n=1 Tax=Sphingobacterium sp. HJSM2_6 TaxID=3366264 RepID=UPI003BF4F22C
MKLLFSIILLSFLFSCASRNELVYFQQDSVVLNTTNRQFTTKFQPGDILTISITADDLKVSSPYNQVNIYQAGTLQSNSPFVPTYTIDQDGFIDFPQLGKIKLGGLTRLEAIDYIKKEVGKDIHNPGANITLRNFKISVLGEVVRPGTFTIDNDRVSILEALGLAGDMTINGVRKNVLVVREEDGQKNEYRIDLTKRESLNSPVYFLKQNDVIYVEPNGARIQSSKYTQNTSIFVSIAGLIITIVAVIVR